MSVPLISPHPFGHTITAAMLKDTFAALQQWEDRYRQLIQLSKQLPPLPESLKTTTIELAGCENRVWLSYQVTANRQFHFYADSDSRIVRGLLAILLTAIEGQTAAQLCMCDPLWLFDELNLRAQLSASRGAGLNALKEAVLAAARTTR